jgi:hypothetical protein
MTNKISNFLELIRYGFKNVNSIKAVKLRDPLKNKLYLVNMEIGKMDYHNPLYLRRVKEFNQAMIEYNKGRFFATSASSSKSKDDWKKAFTSFKRAKKFGKKLSKSFEQGTEEEIEYKKSKFEKKGTEIIFADGAPLIPEITPIVILKGTDYEMGFQYAKQLVEIFGSWILKKKAGKNFSELESKVLREWEEQHRKHTPWLIDFCRGWSDSSKTLGVNMSYDDVLDLWIGQKAPAKDFLDSCRCMGESDKGWKISHWFNRCPRNELSDYNYWFS